MSTFIVVLIVLIGGGALLLRQLRIEDRRQLVLDSPAGHTKSELIDALGQPKSISSMAQGRTLLQWQSPGKHLVMSFNGDVCEGVTHQYDANGLKA